MFKATSFNQPTKTVEILLEMPLLLLKKTDQGPNGVLQHVETTESDESDESENSEKSDESNESIQFE